MDENTLNSLSYLQQQKSRCSLDCKPLPRLNCVNEGGYEASKQFGTGLEDYMHWISFREIEGNKFYEFNILNSDYEREKDPRGRVSNDFFRTKYTFVLTLAVLFLFNK